MNVLFLELNNFGADDLMAAFEKMGIYARHVVFEEMHERVSEQGDEKLDELMGKQCPNGKSCDCVFTFNFSPLVSNACKRNNVKYVAWTYDNPLVALFSYTIINSCNYVFVFDSTIYSWFQRQGISTVYYMPLAANVARLDSMKVSKAIENVVSGDIAFVGSMYNEKHNLYDRLGGMPDFVKGYLDGVMAAQMKVQGYFFVEEMLKGEILEKMKEALEYKPNKYGVETPEYVYANYFIARKIAGMERKHLLEMLSEKYNVNLFTHNPTPELPKINNKGPVDYYDKMPYVFKCNKINLNISLRSIQTGIPLRCMDVMGAGGFLLTNYQADMFEYFVPDEDFVYYESDEDLMKKCDYYLSHDDKRKQIAANGHRKVLENHTYEKTLQNMFDIVFGN